MLHTNRTVVRPGDVESSDQDRIKAALQQLAIGSSSLHFSELSDIVHSRLLFSRRPQLSNGNSLSNVSLRQVLFIT